MAINRPTTKTIISTTQWGVPITDAVNLNTTDVAALKTATNVTAWTAPTFLNGWANLGAGYSGAAYRKVGDMVQIRGLVAGGTIGTPMFVLPSGFRPPGHLQFSVSSYTNLPAVLDINTNGNVQPNVGDNRTYSINCSFSTI